MSGQVSGRSTELQGVLRMIAVVASEKYPFLRCVSQGIDPIQYLLKIGKEHDIAGYKTPRKCKRLTIPGPVEEKDLFVRI